MGLYSILWRESGTADDFVALDDSGLAPLYSDVETPSRRTVQIEQPYNSRNIFARATGNQNITVTFRSVTTHASDAAALAYIKAQRAALPDTMDLQIVQGATTNTYTGCVFTGYEPKEQTGKSNSIRYTFEGGIES